MPSREIPQRGAAKGAKPVSSATKPSGGSSASSPSSSRSKPEGKFRPEAKAKGSRPLQPKGAYAVISRRAADRLRGGHVWVYISDVEKIVAPSDDSRLIAVLDPRGAFLGTALHSAGSQIALRMISAHPIDPAAWAAIFRERMRAAIRLRGDLSGGRSDSCRLVFSEADFLPGLIADKYNDLVVLQALTQGMASAAIQAAFLDVVRQEVAPRAVFARSDSRLGESGEVEPASAHDDPLLLGDGDGSGANAASTIFHLNGIGFHYDANSGQKTGAFLDQRENYAAAARFCRGEALDVCTYHGGFALHLARVCGRVTGVDASRAALEVAERNLDLNRSQLAAEVDWVEANAFDLLRDWSAGGRQFDSIVLDPPAFAKSKRAVEGALRGYKELNLRALRMLRPGGVLVACSCSHHVGNEEFTAVVAAAASDARRQVRLLERRGAAGDHPVLLAVPETEYLKCLVCRVE
jgi:23S rRNA (cytosine1962-C5)-methyltransferase